jgi:phosphoribosylanthranilate isomerase
VTRVKICCIRSIEEAQLAIRHGAHAVGLVSEMPTGNRGIADKLIREIAQAIPPGVSSFLLTSRIDPEGIIDHQRQTLVNTIQLVDRVSPADVVRVKNALPGISVVQVVHVNDTTAVTDADSYASIVDALLLDSGTPDGPVRTLGGTGRTHDWKLSRQIVRQARCPVFLAGGLDPLNVASAIRDVGPFGVDICSGLRPHGSLDASLLCSFLGAVQSAAA